LKLTAIPFLHASSELVTNDFLSKADSVPWVGTNVIITKQGNPFKGYVGIVKNVICGQDTASGLKVVVQLTHLNLSAPFKITVINYDDVVEQQ
jgi:hypothetical protein